MRKFLMLVTTKFIRMFMGKLMVADVQDKVFLVDIYRFKFDGEGRTS